MVTKLERIAEVAKSNPNEKFTSLIHLINKETIIQSHNEMKANKATGVDEVTKELYATNLIENTDVLIAKMKRQAYKPQPGRRVHVKPPKNEGTCRSIQ